MLYELLKIPARLAFLLYCRMVWVHPKKLLAARGPLLLAVNHPNSFLDAVIIATLFRRPVYSLARGDVYSRPLYIKLLTAMKMLPVYRISEGAENLENNYHTFQACRDIFKKNGIVLIFSEGRCENEWHLRPLKKGTARLAISSWQEGIPLVVIPVGINYQAFRVFGKNVQIKAGNPIYKKDTDLTNGFGNSIKEFNGKLQHELEGLVIEAKAGAPELSPLFIRQSKLKKALLQLPAFLGRILHFPIYRPVQHITWKKAGHTGHYDSIIVGLLFILYPFYLGLLALVVSHLTPGYWWISTFLLMPFFAWSYLQLKPQA